MRKLKVPFYVFFAVFLFLLTTCKFSRDDLYKIATARPDIHIILIDTDVFSFGQVDVYDIKKHVFQIENMGSRELELKKIYTSDADKHEFIIDIRETNSVVKPGKTTTFTVFFKPTGAEPTEVDVLIESNDPDESIYQFSLYGEGLWGSGNPPEIVVEEGGVPLPYDGTYTSDFGSVLVGRTSASDFTIRNATSAAYMLAVTDISSMDGNIEKFNRIAPLIPASLKPGESIHFSMLFSPESDAFYQAQIEIVSDDPVNGSFTFFVEGAGKYESNIRVLYGTRELVSGTGILDFGNIPNNESDRKVLKLENTGNMPLNVSDIYIHETNSPTVFRYTGPTSLQIPPGGKEQISINFDPIYEIGSRDAELKIVSDDPNYAPSYHFTLKGYAESTPVPDINVINNETGSTIPSGSTGHDFSTVTLGTSVTVPFTVENTGTADLILDNIYLASGDTSQFMVESVSYQTLPPGENIQFEVTYEPTMSGSHTATIAIDNNDPDGTGEESPYLINFSGKGSEKDVADIQVLIGKTEYKDGSSYYFSSLLSPTRYGNSDLRKVTIKNTGSAVLVISDILLVGGEAGDFSYDLKIPVNIKPGSAVDFTIIFKPTVNPLLFAYKRDTRLQITSNDPNESPYKIDLIGYVL